MSTNNEAELHGATFEEAAAFVAGKVAFGLSDDEVAEWCAASLLKLPGAPA